MPSINSYVFYQLLVPSILLFLLIGSVAGVVIGAGLIGLGRPTLEVIRRLNRWVSTRRSLKPVEIPRDFDATVRHRRLLSGTVFVAASAYSLFFLLEKYDVAGVAAAFGAHNPHLSLITVVVVSLKWFMIFGCVAAFAAGLMLLFFPRTMLAIEAHANRWISTRQLATGGDTMYVSLDRLVEIYPRKSGWVILLLSLFVALNTASLLIGRL